MPNSLKEKIRPYYNKIVPQVFRSQIIKMRTAQITQTNSMLKKITQYYEIELNSFIFSEEISNLKKYNNVGIYPYSFRDIYTNYSVDVNKDESKQMLYVMHCGKRLYYPRSYSIQEVKSGYIGLLMEQDKDSPHLYLTDNFYFPEGGIMMDVGAAEGFLALEVVEKARKVYVFECNPLWLEALAATFSPWADKVIIVNKYVSNIVSDTTCSLDSFIPEIDDEIVFIKLDVEGMEAKCLQGAHDMLQRAGTKVCCCTYHKLDDAFLFYEFFSRMGYGMEFSKGVLHFPCKGNRRRPYFTKGVLRAEKKC